MRVRAWTAMAGIGLLAGCAGGGADGGADGTWVGTLRTLAGTCPGGASDLSVDAGSVVFVPGDGVLSLRGTRNPADPDAVRAQLAGTDMNHRPFAMVFEGRREGAVVRGTYGTPSCRASIEMRRPDRPLLKRITGD